MSLLPFFYDVDRRPFGLLESDFFRNHPHRGSFNPFFNWDIIQPLAEAMNQLGMSETAISPANDEDKFQVNVDVQHFAPEEINVKVVDGQVLIEGKHEERRDDHGFISRQFIRKYSLPEGCLPDTVESQLSSDGVLTVTAPKVLVLPSTGEKIVPIKKTGPVKKQISTYSAEPEEQKSLEK